MNFQPDGGPEAFGYHFLIGLSPGHILQTKDRELLARLKPAGIILFADNFHHGQPYPVWLSELAELLADVRACIGREKILVCIDHEGGRVVRTPPPITRFGHAAQWRDRAFEVGRAMGVELRSLGINLSFAPVVDIHSNPANPIIGPRAFGSEPEIVIEAARRFLDGLAKGGIFGCLKHYPGHGDTALDSHLALPVVDQPESVLRERELVPFARLASTGVPCLMTGHILFPQVDAEPATLSHKFLTQILRTEFGYEGLILSDDLGMAAVAERFLDPGTMALAFNAGCDLFLLCAALTDTARAAKLAADLYVAYREGAISEQSLSLSYHRIANLLDKAPQHPVSALAGELFEAHGKLLETTV